MTIPHKQLPQRQIETTDITTLLGELDATLATAPQATETGRAGDYNYCQKILEVLEGRQYKELFDARSRVEKAYPQPKITSSL